MILGLLSGVLPAQPPKNDFCAFATPIEPGQTLAGLSNAMATVSSGGEAPATEPTTCIQTLENDLWFTFTTVGSIESYEIVISHNQCNSPAGMQALLLRTDDCQAANFKYAGCSNLISTDTIKIFLTQPLPGVKYLIYVDGYDGTICNFNLSLNGRNMNSVSAKDFKFIRFDYDTRTEPGFFPLSSETEFANNALTLRWRCSTSEETSFFIIERKGNGMSDPSYYTYYEVVGVLPSKGLVAGGEILYEFTDYMTSFRNQRYCYRIVKVNPSGEKSFGEEMCFTAQLIESFIVEDVKRSSEPGKYIVRYMNYAKNKTYGCTVYDADMKVVKFMQLVKEPVRDGTITINMQEFLHGTYYFKMDNGKEFYMRRFDVF